MKRIKALLIMFLLLVTCFGALSYIYIQIISFSENDIKSNVSNSINAYAQSSTRDSSQLLARAINGEARGEPYVGQVAVGAVILNRVKHPSFPKSIAGVIYQPGAFTAVSDGQIDAQLSTNSSAYKAAKDCMSGWDPSGGAIYYYNPAKTTNQWIWSRPVITVIGKHRFAK